jgi:hypothetical protein
VVAIRRNGSVRLKQDTGAFPMNLTINVPDEQEPALKARAQAQGLSPEEFVGQVPKREQ